MARRPAGARYIFGYKILVLQPCRIPEFARIIRGLTGHCRKTRPTFSGAGFCIDCGSGFYIMPANGEVSVLGVIKSVLPDGTTRSNHWTTVCDWPPDLFAAVATITERSGLYAEPAFVSYWCGEEFELTKKWIASARAIGNEWAVSASPPKIVAAL